MSSANESTSESLSKSQFTQIDHGSFKQGQKQCISFNFYCWPASSEISYYLGKVVAFGCCYVITSVS